MFSILSNNRIHILYIFKMKFLFYVHLITVYNVPNIIIFLPYNIMSTVRAAVFFIENESYSCYYLKLKILDITIYVNLVCIEVNDFGQLIIYLSTKTYSVQNYRQVRSEYWYDGEPDSFFLTLAHYRICVKVSGNF